MHQVTFIINPFSAKKNYHPFLDELRRKVDNPNVYISTSIAGTHHFIDENFEKTEIFIAIGGDGTISTVASKLIGTEKILGIFPAGSGNGFSNETQFSKNLDELLSKIKNKNYTSIDTFTVNENLSINVSGTGFDGKVVKEFEKTSRGFQNYIKVSVKTFFSYKPIKIKFITESLQKYNGKYLMVNIANTRQFGNNAFIAPQADYQDGLVDLVLVKKFPFWYAAKFAFRMFTKNLEADQFITYVSTDAVSFQTNTKNWHIDGEFRKIKSPVLVKVQPKSLRILV